MRDSVADSLPPSSRIAVSLASPIRAALQPGHNPARVAKGQAMLVATTEKVAGYRTKQTLGQVFGVVVRSR
ncbi:MAG TPA: hypothetical protein VN932_00075, partial [Rhizomicrobium sp.]|nr:hypothetical protein [Rhizomicrobium sp.]